VCYSVVICCIMSVLRTQVSTDFVNVLFLVVYYTSIKRGIEKTKI
jgi:hypothetical protein